MAKRKEASKVIINAQQRDRLERLWFYYGNYGPKTTYGNHQFIQRILEQGIDVRSAFLKRTPKRLLPTPECEEAVDKILADPSIKDARARSGLLRLMTPTAKARRPPAPDDELKAILDDMRRRSRVSSEGPEGGNGPPEAA